MIVKKFDVEIWTDFWFFNQNFSSSFSTYMYILYLNIRLKLTLKQSYKNLCTYVYTCIIYCVSAVLVGLSSNMHYRLCYEAQSLRHIIWPLKFLTLEDGSGVEDFQIPVVKWNLPMGDILAGAQTTTSTSSSSSKIPCFMFKYSNKCCLVHPTKIVFQIVG